MLSRSSSKLIAAAILFFGVSAEAGPTSLLLGTTDIAKVASNTSTSYLLVSGMKGTSLTEADVMEGLPPGTLRKLSCVVDQTPPNTGTLTMTVRVAAADTALTCTIGTAVTRCSDLANSATIGADPRVDIKVVPASTPAVGQLSCRLYYTRT